MTLATVGVLHHFVSGVMPLTTVDRHVFFYLFIFYFIFFLFIFFYPPADG